MIDVLRCKTPSLQLPTALTVPLLPHTIFAMRKLSFILEIPGEPKLSDYFMNKIFRELSTSYAKFDVHEIARLMEIYTMLVSFSI